MQARNAHFNLNRLGVIVVSTQKISTEQTMEPIQRRTRGRHLVCTAIVFLPDGNWIVQDESINGRLARGC